MSFRIEGITAFTQIDDVDEEGIIAFMAGDTWMPMIAADHERVTSMRPYAELVARETGRPVRLVRFQVGTLIELIEP